MISVIIPLYNKEKTIKQTILSVINQSYKNFEIVIINDGSTDNSVNVIRDINDKRIKLFNINNSGVSHARNFGIDNSTGEYIFFLDADDLIYPECLSTLINTFEEYPVTEIVFSNYFFVESNGSKILGSRIENYKRYLKNPLKLMFLNKISLRTGVMLFKRTTLVNNKFNTKISVHEDTDLWVRLLTHAKIAYTPEVLHEYQKLHSILSEIKIDIKKEFSYYIELNKCKSLYQFMIYCNNINGSIIRRIFMKDYKSTFILINRYFFYLPILLLTYIITKSIK